MMHEINGKPEPGKPDKPEDTTLACGCALVFTVIAEQNVMVVEPCSLQCTNLEFVMEESERQSKPIVGIL